MRENQLILFTIHACKKCYFQQAKLKSAYLHYFEAYHFLIKHSKFFRLKLVQKKPSMQNHAAGET